MDLKNTGIIFSQEQLSDGDLSSSPSRPASPTAVPSGLVKSHTAVLNPDPGSNPGLSSPPTSPRPAAPSPTRSRSSSPTSKLAGFSRPASPVLGNFETGYYGGVRYGTLTTPNSKLPPRGIRTLFLILQNRTAHEIVQNNRFRLKRGCLTGHETRDGRRNWSRRPLSRKGSV